MSISFLLLFANLLVVLSTSQKEMINKRLKDLNKEFSSLRKLAESNRFLIGFDNYYFVNNSGLIFYTYFIKNYCMYHLIKIFGLYRLLLILHFLLP